MAGNPEPIDWKATLKKRQGEFHAARLLYDRVARLSPRDPEVRGEIAITYHFERRYEEARAYYDSALALAPDHLAVNLDKHLTFLHQEGETAPLRLALSEIPGGIDPSGAVTLGRWQVEFFDGEYEAALEILSATNLTHIETQEVYYPTPLLAGFVYRAAGDTSDALAAFDAARGMLVSRIQDNPADERLRTALGMALAGLGQHEDATREGHQALELMPSSRDALRAQGPLMGMVVIYAIVGEKEAAMDHLERYLSNPGEWSIRGLSRDPRLVSLRDHPRF